MRYVQNMDRAKVKVLAPDFLVEQIVNGVLAKIITGSSWDAKYLYLT